MPQRTLEAAATLRAGAWDRFFTVAVPLARPGFVTASVLGFAHTVGEFGVVLMLFWRTRDARFWEERAGVADPDIVHGVKAAEADPDGLEA